MLKACIIISLVELLLCIICATAIAIYKAKKEKKHIALKAKAPKQSHIQRLLFELPYRIVTDMFNRKDYQFDENGFHLFVGEQGSGKTVTMVYMLLLMKQKYPNLKIRTNMFYKYQDGEIKNWKDLVFKSNGTDGQIDVLDEVQNWFNSLESKDFPVEMFQEITQQRKQTKCIYGTAQVWQRVAKPIREQVKLLYKPITLLGCLTIVRIYKPIVNSEGDCDEMKYRGMFYFVHTDEIRNSFDTYRKIQSMSLKGFKEQKLNPYTYDVVLPFGTASAPKGKASS